MTKNQPKKHITNVKLKQDTEYGLALRKSYAKTILQNAPAFPKPLEYKDIDEAFYDFVKKEIKMIIKGKEVPTFTLYSNQRFSEYSQTWKHVDEENNLLMNFKTVSREPNPKPGENQGGLWNIPGDKRYTLLIKTVLEDNGTESYEIHSMKQPFCVDISYKVSLITDIFENINTFNSIINNLFKARQHYIRPNGHFIPMILEEVNDNSEYTISDRKFFNQTIIIKVMAYIIQESDFKVDKKPKRIKLFMDGDTKRPKPKINIEEYYNDKIKNTALDLIIDFNEWDDRVEFEIDTDFIVETTELYNIRNIRVSVNDIPYYIDKGFELHNGDNVKIIIKHVDVSEKSQIKFAGIDPNRKYVEGDDDVSTYEEMIIR